MPLLIELAIVAVLSLLMPASHAQEVVKTCRAVEVHSIQMSAEAVPKVLSDVRAVTQVAYPDAAAKAVVVTAYGPILGSMDSPKVETDLACTAKGFVLTATITRSASFNGSALQNVNWRPRITMAVGLLKPEGVVQTIWKMRLTTGASVDHAQTPPYDVDQKYPIRLTKTIRTPSSQQR